jgi:epoxyqueuosine reductase
MSYYTKKEVDLGRPGDPHGRVSRYAWGPDYHGYVAQRAEQLCDYLRHRHDAIARPKACVDTSALAERAVARRSGVGWFGKNTMLLTTTYGSWVFLAEVVTDLELEPDVPLKKSCGACHRCIPACPTGALDTPYELDARLCISLLTIELRGAIPRALRAKMGSWIFGCDLCQEICPINRTVACADQSLFESEGGIGPSPALLPLLQLDDAGFRARFRHSPIKRAGRNGLVRNACVALGNARDPVAIGPLAATLVADLDAMVRIHAAWALGRFAEPEAGRLLRLALKGETDATVRAEIVAAIEHHL